jgi:hypothetical protein
MNHQILGLTLLILPACQYHVREIPDLLAAERTQAGFSVGVTGYLDGDASRAILDENVTDQFWPVYVAIANDNDGMAILEIGDCKIVSQDGIESPVASAAQVYAEYKLNEGATVVGASLAGGLVVGSLAAKESSELNDAMFRDWSDKELTRYLLGPGERDAGLLYFRANRGAPPYRLQVVLDNRVSHERVTVTLPLAES